MLDLAIVVGHSEDSQGAVSSSGSSEWTWNTRLAEEVAVAAFEAGISTKVLFRPNTGSYSEKMEALVAEVNALRPRLVLSLHFNAAFGRYTGTWEGTSALHFPGSKVGKLFAEKLSEQVACAQGTRFTAKTYGIRGAIAKTHNDRGAELYIITQTRSPAVLLESHFGDNPSEHNKAEEAMISGRTAASVVYAVRSVLDA